LLDGLAALFARPSPGRSVQTRSRGWRRVDDVVVLSELGDVLASRNASVPELLLPFQDAVLREEAEGGDGWGLAARVLALEGEDAFEQAGHWRSLSLDNKKWLGDEGRDAVVRVIDAWESRVVVATDESLTTALGTDDEFRTLAFAQGRLERARERERYVIKDRSSRPLLMQSLPPYEVVHLLTRYHNLYSGFLVREATRRVVLERYDDGTPVAGQLIGRVRAPDLGEVLGQRTSEHELIGLKKKTVRTPEDEERIVELTAELLRDDEMRGSWGIESYFDQELRGRNGYRETDGLQERSEGRGSRLFQAPVDGKDVELTLDLDLQRAAKRTLENPQFDRREPYVDQLWLDNPVGAIVVMTPEGEVLVATSEPTVAYPAPLTRLSQRAVPIDRTMRRPTFNPPGSVLKPFVAAWALEYHDLDPYALFECAALADGLPGYKVMHCTHRHDDVDLDEALRGSCNAYFARVGDELYTAAGFMRMAHGFGFGRPTGVKSFGSDGRTGFLDQYKLGDDVEHELRHPSNRMRATNGLGHVDATPMQVARATAGLLEGKLPAVRLVRSIGGDEVPASFEEVEVSEAHLARVRQAMCSVVTEKDGTAFGKGLDADSLGFTIAIKTGSADFSPFREASDDPRYPAKKNRMRKHTWIAGWFPVEDPKAVFVIYLHDVSETSSHTAVWTARQFLGSHEVATWLLELEGAAGRDATAIEASSSKEKPR
jgi:cell division protein FtsI/penicillin-binding protein 2